MRTTWQLRSSRRGRAGHTVVAQAVVMARRTTVAARPRGHMVPASTASLRGLRLLHVRLQLPALGEGVEVVVVVVASLATPPRLRRRWCERNRYRPRHHGMGCAGL